MVKRTNDEIRIQAQYRLTEELVAARQRYRSFAEHVRDIVLECDETGIMTYVNPAWMRLLGFRLEDTIGRSVREFLSGPLLDAQATLPLGQRCDVAGHRVDGAVLVLEAYFWPSVPHGLNGLLHDVTERKRAQEALRINEEKLRTITNTALDAVVMINSQGKIVYGNPATESIFGFSLGEMVGQDVHSLLAPSQYRDAAQQAHALFSLSGRGAAIGKTKQLTALRQDGSEFPIELSVNAIRQEDGWRAVAIIRDVTQRQQAEVALRASETKYRRIFETIQDVYMEVEADSGKMIEISPSIEGVSGYRREELLGRHVKQLLVNPRQRKGLLRVIKNGQTANDFEVDLRHRNGRLRTISLSASLVHNDRGESPRIVGTGRDITDRKRIEEERELSRRTLQKILESMPVGVAIVGRDRIVRHVNSAALAMMGYDNDESVVNRICHQGLCPSHQRTCPVLDEGAVLDNSEKVLVTRDGTEIPILKNVIPLRLNNEDVLLETFVDISARKEFERQLDEHVAALESMNRALAASNGRAEAATRAKSQFLANMSHEIRTPIAAILGFAELLCDPEGRTARDVRWARRIRSNADHLRQLLNDVLDLARIEAGRLRVAEESCPIAPIVDDVAAMFREQANARQLDFGVQHGAGVPSTVRGDQTRIRQILVNLVSNAVKFTPSGGVTISTHSLPAGGDQPATPEVRICVVDTGVGIALDQTTRLFQPFERLQEAETETPGTGLGLAISHRLARLMGGRIDVQSVEGKGSRFTLALPAYSVKTTTRKLSDSSCRTSTAGSLGNDLFPGLNVLLVEDNADNEEVFRNMLLPCGVTLSIAHNGAEAIEIVLRQQAAESAFDVILMDMQMPVMDGFSATSVLRGMGIRVPIIAVTAYAMEHQQQQCLEAGCDTCLAKPFQRHDLYSALRRVKGTKTPGRALPTPHSLPDWTADQGFAVVLKRYLHTLRQCQSRIAAAEKAGDLREIHKISHQLKGTAAMYGFDDIGRAAARCQDALQESSDIKLLAQPISQLKQALHAALASSHAVSDSP